MRVLSRVGITCAWGLLFFTSVAALPSCRRRPVSLAQQITAASDRTANCPAVEIRTPHDGTVFSPESLPPDITWSEGPKGIDTWMIEIGLSTGDALQVITQGTAWTPPAQDWNKVKELAAKDAARLRVFGVAKQSPSRLLARGQITFSVSTP
jgi:hypothetical protein